MIGHSFLLAKLLISVSGSFTPAPPQLVTQTVPRLITAPKIPEKKNRTVCTGSYCIPSDYDQLAVPDKPSVPLQVKIDLDQVRIIEFDDRKFTVSLSMFLAVHWMEDRLYGPAPSPTAPYQAIDTQFIENLWVPDIYIYNMEGINRILTDFKGRLFVVNGREIYFRQEVVVTLWCPMRFEFYPLDQQECKFRIGSFSFPLSRLVFSVSNLEQELSRPNTLLDYTRMDELTSPDQMFVSHAKGNYSVTGFRLQIKRRVFKFIVNYYLPAGLFVLVSWASFLIPPDLIPGRMNLLVALFLVLINIFNSVTRQIPNSEGLNALVAYLLTCIFFVFGAMCGYSGILFVRNRRLRKVGGGIETTPVNSSRPSITISVIGTLMGPAFAGSPNLNQLPVEQQPSPVPGESSPRSSESAAAPKAKGPWQTRHEFAHIDNAFLVAFPAMFVVFNLLYWGICLTQ